MPKPHEDGSPIQPEEFPSQIPAYKIYVKPQLRVEGQVVASGGSFTLGKELLGEGGFTAMNLSNWDLTLDDQVAGQTGALGVSLQGISAAQLQGLQQRLQDTQQKLQANQLETLTGEHLSGDLLVATVWSYFAAIESFGRIAQRQASMVDTPGLSYGFFYGQVVPVTRYGVVTSVKFPGVLMDIGHQRRIAYSKTNDRSAWVNYNRLRGQHSSAMEHAIPERFFDDPNDSITPRGVSAVKAIAIAASQGQRIYTLTPQNQAQLGNIQQSTGVMDNIRAALNAGMEVTIHQLPINYAGFDGAGYIIVNPETGGGAYLIEGGANGGILEQVLAAFVFFGGISTLVLPIAILAFASTGGFIGALVALAAAVGYLIVVALLDDDYKFRFSICAGLAALAFALGGLISAPAAVLGTAAKGALFGIVSNVLSVLGFVCDTLP